MAYQTEMIRENRVLIQTVEDGFRGGDIALMFGEAVNRLDLLGVSAFYIIDIQATNVRFGDIVMGANMATSGERPIFQHPQVWETLVITRDPVIRTAAEGLATPVYGSIKIRVFDTLDDAVAYCDQKIA